MTITSVAELEQARAALAGRPAAELERADRWLDAVERCVLSRDPKAALQLLARFMDSIEQISVHCWDDDFGSSQLSDRAWAMVERLAATLSAEDVGPAIERLRVEFAARAAGSGR